MEEAATVVETPEVAPEQEAPAEEIAPAEEVEFIPEKEQVVAEEQVAEGTAKAETPAEVPVEEELAVVEPQAETEQDWSQVITAPAPEQEAEAQPAQEEKPVAEAAPAEAEKPAEAEPAKPQTTKDAKKASFVDKLTDLLKKVGNFVVKEKLLSAGIFVCFIGVIYIIIALIISARRERREDAYYEKKPGYDSEVEETVKSKQDTDPESEDDEFLRSLLGDS